METFVKSLRTYAEGKMFPITVKLFDPSGNSYIKNPNAPKIDKNMHIVNFTRTAQQL